MDILHVVSPDGEVTIRLKNLLHPEQASPVDWVIVASKAYDAASTAMWFPALMAEGASVAIAQNGVEHRERFAPWVSQERLLPVVVQISVDRQSDGSMHQHGLARLIVEEGQLGRGFAELFSGSNSEVVVTGDFMTALWQKLCVNSTGSLSVLAGKPFGQFRVRDETLRRTALQMVGECIAVARAEGAHLDDGTAQRIVDGIMTGTRDRSNSMLADRLAGRPMEIDTRNGVIVRLGEKHGIPTPLHRMVVALLLSV